MEQTPRPESSPVAVLTSSFCSGHGCVGVASTPDSVTVVDTKTSARLTFSTAEWAAFVAGVKAGEFDLDLAR